MSEVIQGWRIGAVYKSESGELFKIVNRDLDYTDIRAILISDSGRTPHWFDIQSGNVQCTLKTCTHGNLTNLVDTNTTTYKIRGKE